MSSNTTYYVYAYLRSKDSKTAKAGTPYYIGKGQGRRAFERHGKIPVPEDKSNIVFLKENTIEIDAFEIEIFLIAYFGRKDIKTGILNNRTDGGEGVSGSLYPSNRTLIHTENLLVAVRKSITPERNAKISKSRTGMKFTTSTCNAMRDAKLGTTRPQEVKDKISLTSSGKSKPTRTEAHNNKLSAAQKGIPKGPQPKTTCPHCGKIGGRSAMTRCHFDNCKMAKKVCVLR